MEGPSSLLLSSTVTTQDFSKVQRASPNPCVSVPTLAPRSSTLGDSTLWRAYKPHSCDLDVSCPFLVEAETMKTPSCSGATSKLSPNPPAAEKAFQTRQTPSEGSASLQ